MPSSSRALQAMLAEAQKKEERIAEATKDVVVSTPAIDVQEGRLFKLLDRQPASIYAPDLNPTKTARKSLEELGFEITTQEVNAFESKPANLIYTHHCQAFIKSARDKFAWEARILVQVS